jgi:WD40-like Beta Propeller Repeat
MKRRMPITVFHAMSAARGEVRGNSQAGPHEGGHLGKQFFRIAGAAGYTCLLLVALALASVPPADAQEVCVPQFSDWSAPVNLGPVVNSAGTDQGAAISKDELELYFVREVGGFGLGDLWVSTREHKKDPWGPPLNLGPTINTSARESTPALSRDGLRLYFSSARDGGLGGMDIWVSERIDKRDPLGWGRGPHGLPIPPVNLGSGVNSAAGDVGPALFEDREAGTVTLYFYSTRPRDPDDLTADRDIYASVLSADGSFGPAVLVPELSTDFEDEQPSIRRDGLEMFFVSNRPGSVVNPTTGLPSSDIWVSTRASTSDPWSPPVNLGPCINTAGLEGRPALSFDGRSLYFFSNGHGGSRMTDLFVSTRTKLDDFDDGDDDD